ncbi:MAG: TauD/TfdA family dioxygenase [Alphaproteobacteria bacterium]|nr:TauD/TfdA family dioxygenase [Alphaproteobacteria bacterium]
MSVEYFRVNLLEEQTFSGDAVGRALLADGLALFRNVSEERLRAAATHLGKIFMHPDSQSDGLTVIRPSESGGGSEGNARGLSSQSLFPHTDRASLPQPPEVVFFWCEQCASIGGKTTFVDGRLLYEELLSGSAELKEFALAQNSCVFSGGDSMLAGGMYTRLDPERVKLRFRFDDLLYVSKRYASVLPSLEQVIQGLSLSFHLRPGQGYVVQNTRWLHGRTEFQGLRVCSRLLVHVDSNWKSLDSFSIKNTRSDIVIGEEAAASCTELVESL